MPIFNLRFVENILNRLKTNCIKEGLQTCKVMPNRQKRFFTKKRRRVYKVNDKSVGNKIKPKNF